jgi:hypothetical protein
VPGWEWDPDPMKRCNRQRRCLFPDNTIRHSPSMERWSSRRA